MERAFPWSRDEPDLERWATAEWSVGMNQFSAKTARMEFAALLLFGNAVKRRPGLRLHE